LAGQGIETATVGSEGVVGAMSGFGMGRYDLAIADYATAISLDPRNGGLFAGRGKIFVKAGRLNEGHVLTANHVIEDSRQSASSWIKRNQSRPVRSLATSQMILRFSRPA
jgi:hypothetical protein